MSLKYEVNLYPKLLLEYCCRGKLHRVDCPAEIYYDRDMFWFEYGQLHRISGPSGVYSYGVEYYNIRGKPYSKVEYDNVIKTRNDPNHVQMDPTEGIS